MKLILLFFFLIVFIVFLHCYLSFNKKKNRNPQDFKICFNYMNHNWENFESRYGHLSDEIIRKQLFPMIKEIKQSLSSNECIYDVGGNIGEITELFHEYYPNNVIHTFEPVNNNFIQLRKKFEMIQNIKLNHIALGSFDGQKSSHTMGSGFLGDYLYPHRLLAEFKTEYMTADSYYKNFCICTI